MQEQSHLTGRNNLVCQTQHFVPFEALIQSNWTMPFEQQATSGSPCAGTRQCHPAKEPFASSVPIGMAPLEACIPLNHLHRLVHLAEGVPEPPHLSKLDHSLMSCSKSLSSQPQAACGCPKSQAGRFLNHCLHI